MMRQGYGVSG